MTTVWVTSAGGEKADGPSDMVVDGNGNLYVIGGFKGIATFGNHKLVAKGDFDVFVAKLDPGGTFTWAVSAGSVGLDVGSGIAVDASGDAYITGSFVYGATFGPHTLSAGTARNIFVARLDPLGNFTWATKAKATSSISGRDILSNQQGAVFVAGEFNGQPELGTTTLASKGGADWFVARLDGTGSFVWAVSNGGLKEDNIWGMALESAGNILIAGDLDAPGAAKIFVSRLSPTDGKITWTTPVFYGFPLGGIAADTTGGSYVTGHYENTVTFGKSTLTSQGAPDIFVARLGPTGQPLWASSSGGSGWDMGYGIGAASGGGAFVAGKYQSKATFGATTHTSQGSNDIFVSKIDAAGKYSWTISAGGSGSDSPCCVAQNGQGDVVVAGAFEGTAQFASKPAISQGEWDVFVWKVKLK